MGSSISTCSSHSRVLSLKVLLVSTAVVSVAMALKLTVPLLSHFIVSEGPSIWSSLLTWLRPPYLYILVNCIILGIVASSKFNNRPPLDDTALLPPKPVNVSGDVSPEYAAHDRSRPDAVVLSPVKIAGEFPADYNVVVSDGYVYAANTPAKKTLSNSEITNGSDENILTWSRSIGTSLQRKESLDFTFPSENEKPPASAGFGHRKTVKSSPEAGAKVALGVAKPKRQDTLESTWKTITEGRARPLTRHLKKSDTWDSQTCHRHAPLSDQNGHGAPLNSRLVKKSETFAERSKTSGKENESPPSSGGRLRKEASLSQDELNRRAEAFIKKFNEEMRLQRQESLRQYARK